MTDHQRRCLAAKAKGLGRKALDCVAMLVTPNTLVCWHRRLIALKWTHAAKGVGRPGLKQTISDLIDCMATENSSWGYSRIQCELRTAGHTVAGQKVPTSCWPKERQWSRAVPALLHELTRTNAASIHVVKQLEVDRMARARRRPGAWTGWARATLMYEEISFLDTTTASKDDALVTASKHTARRFAYLICE